MSAWDSTCWYFEELQIFRGPTDETTVINCRIQVYCRPYPRSRRCVWVHCSAPTCSQENAVRRCHTLMCAAKSPNTHAQGPPITLLIVDAHLVCSDEKPVHRPGNRGPAGEKGRVGVGGAAQQQAPAKKHYGDTGVSDHAEVATFGRPFMMLTYVKLWRGGRSFLAPVCYWSSVNVQVSRRKHPGAKRRE